VPDQSFLLIVYQRKAYPCQKCARSKLPAHSVKKKSLYANKVSEQSLPSNNVEEALEIVLFDGSEEAADSATLAEADNNSVGKS
jgi:hypothetical protein